MDVDDSASTVQDATETRSTDGMDVDEINKNLAVDNKPTVTTQADVAMTEAAPESEASASSEVRASTINHTTTITRPSSVITSPAKDETTAQPTTAPSDHATGENESILGGDDHSLGGSESSSERSSPAKGPVRKSSLSFAPLPSRDPIPTKKSIGNLASRNSNADLSKATNINRNSYLDRVTGGKSLGGYRQVEDDNMDLDADEKPELSRDESDGGSKMAKLHNKSSTQRLHDRINMLGKTQPPRPTKSIPAVIANVQPTYPELPKNGADKSLTNEPQTHQTKPSAKAPVHDGDDEEDWIKPLPAKPEAAIRPELTKSRSVDVMEQIVGKTTISQHELSENTEAPAKKKGLASPKFFSKHRKANNPPSPTVQSPELSHKKSVSVSNPPVPADVSTTPLGSPPSKHNLDGHITASKSKLQSIMKSARGLFSSSARVSTQAKLETLSPTTRALQMQANALNGIVESVSTHAADEAATRPPVPPKEPAMKGSLDESRRLRSSTEKQEKATREQQRLELERAREQEQLLAAKKAEQVTESANTDLSQQPVRPTRQSPRRLQKPAEQRVPSAAESASSQSTTQSRSTVQSQKGKEPRRPVKLPKEAASKQKPPPVSIRVGVMSQASQRGPPNNAALSSSLQDSLAPAPAPAPAPARPAGPTKKASNPTLPQSASAPSLNRSVSATSKPRALLAAERKKEQDEREAQRKLEQKREIERKRAAAQEEARKREIQQRQEAERQKERERTAAVAAEDAKRQAQKAAIEKRRVEMNKKEQQHMGQTVNELVSDGSKRLLEQANDLQGRSIRQESQAPSQNQRPELGAGARRPSKLDRPQMIHPPGKAKRVFNPDDEDELAAPIRTQQPQGFQQNNVKRRRTSDEQNVEPSIRPTMAPPIRHSNIKKVKNT